MDTVYSLLLVSTGRRRVEQRMKGHCSCDILSICKLCVILISFEKSLTGKNSFFYSNIEHTIALKIKNSRLFRIRPPSKCHFHHLYASELEAKKPYLLTMSLHMTYQWIIGLKTKKG
jgi:hypothetical protein